MNFRALGLLIAVATMVVGCNERSLRPLTPCTISGVSNKLGSDINDVDMLFMIDTSNSMASEQVLLNSALPLMVQALITGEVGMCPNADPTICQTFRPVKSLRVGVITPDMGNALGGNPGAVLCNNPTNPGEGDDAELFAANRVGACTLTAPITDPWLQFDEGVSDALDFVTDFTCLAAMGIGGCGFEQQAEAVLKALAGSRADADPLTFTGVTGLMGQTAVGGVNEGFIRENSLLSIIVITDEDDCSGTDTDLYDITDGTNQINNNWTSWTNLRWGGASPPNVSDPTASETNSRAAAGTMMNEVDPSLNCHTQSQFLTSVERYVDGILDLRIQDQRDLIVYSVIGGIDQGVVDSARTSTADSATGALQVERFAAMLGDASMTEAIDYENRDSLYFSTGTRQSRITPACRRFESVSTPMAGACVTNWDCAKWADDESISPPSGFARSDAECNGAGECGFPNVAAPARRLIEVAEGIEEGGGSSVVESICQDDFIGALGSIIAKMASILNRACLPVALNPTSAGTVNCDVVEFLPPTGDITTCQQAADMIGGREAEAIRTEDGREVCRINQIAIDRASPSVPIEADDGIGWYYDDFTDATDIGTGSGQVETSVGDICNTYDTAQRIAFTESAKPISGASIKLECLQPTVGGDLTNAEVATPCPWTVDDDTTPICTGDVADTRPLGMICDSLSNTCQFACTSDAECPGGFVCYTREEAAPEGRLACTGDGDCTGDPGMVAIGANTCGASAVCITDAEVASTRPFCANPTCDSTGIGD